MAKHDPREDARRVFDQMVWEEVTAINTRRGHFNREPAANTPRDPDANFAGSRTPALEVVALALSGGGIRSASFSLGVLQAINEHKLFPRIDYLSTVSGGGYIGSALTATMTKTQGKFVFGKSTRAEGAQDGLSSSEVMDNGKVGHLRNYSNYLIPFGGRDIVTAIAIIIRGLVANSAIVLGFALFIAAATVQGSPKYSLLFEPNIFGLNVKDVPFLGWLEGKSFGITILLSLAGLILFVAWAVLRSLRNAPAETEKTGYATWWSLIGGTFIALAVVFAVYLPLAAWAPVWFLLLIALCCACWIGSRSPGEQVRYSRPRNPTRNPPPRRLYDFRNAWWHVFSSYVALALCVIAFNVSMGLSVKPTAYIAILGFFGLMWALSVGTKQWLRRRHSDDAEFRTWWPAIYATYLIVILVFAVFELQPFLIAGMFELDQLAREQAAKSGEYSMLTTFVKWAATVVTPLAAVVTFFREQIGTLFKSVTSSSHFTTKILAFVVTGLVWLAGAALPLLIWIAYLYLCFWGVANDGKPASKDPLKPQPAFHGTVKIEGPGIDLRAELKCGGQEREPCKAVHDETKKNPTGWYDHTPKWLRSGVVFLATPLQPLWQAVGARPDDGYGYFRHTLIAIYFLAGLFLILLTHTLRPNANSLHQLYRARLSKAFLFDPTRKLDTASAVDNPFDRSYAPINTMPLSALADDEPWAPYHLINATLNVQGSDYANRRGRNSDFFLFSPNYIGSIATGYARTKDMERQTNIDLATAMTISGAAFSPNAGASSIAPLRPTLALLNVRTGYWLKNPRCVGPNARPPNWHWSDPFYLWSELTGMLYEDSEDVFLSDGGHIENLGMYELLRRRCKVIIVVDGEADPSLRYPSFITLQRYARIDLGVRITMPWDGVRKTTLQWMGYTGDPTADDKGSKTKGEEPKTSRGPHVSIGKIEYDGDETGWLVYIKASLTGDENDYVRDYARRYEAFPHESTGDQFFSEEQFEVYRALGFHIAYGMLSGRDDICVSPGKDRVERCKFDAGGNVAVQEIRTALGM